MNTLPVLKVRVSLQRCQQLVRGIADQGFTLSPVVLGTWDRGVEAAGIRLMWRGHHIPMCDLALYISSSQNERSCCRLTGPELQSSASQGSPCRLPHTASIHRLKSTMFNTLQLQCLSSHALVIQLNLLLWLWHLDDLERTLSRLSVHSSHFHQSPRRSLNLHQRIK